MAKRNKAVYIVTAFISIVLYLAGILTGINIQQTVSESLEKDLASIKADIENQQQELLLFNLRGKAGCSILQSLSSAIASKLDSVSNEIRQLENSGKNSKFTELKETYSTLSIREWILKSSINENCNEGSLSILYYYSFQCSDCKAQEDILESIKSLNRDKILTYAVDKDVDNSLVQTLVKSHNIKTVPSIVISNNVYQGLTEEKKLKEIVCREINISCEITNIANADSLH